MRLPWFGLQVEGREFRHADPLVEAGRPRSPWMCLQDPITSHTLHRPPPSRVLILTHSFWNAHTHFPPPPGGVQGGAGGVNGCVDTPLAQ